MSVKSIKGETSVEHEKNLAVIQRYRLISDESGHDYAIPVYLTEEFYKWVDATEDGADYEGEGFDKYRVEGTLTFTDPQT